MSEFRVVKCKKCDAALTEIVGERLTNCVQCGYKFILQSNTKSQHSTETNTNSRASSEITSLVNKLKQLKTHKKEENLSESLKPKKPIWISIVKWYFILIFSMGVLSQCFNK